MTTQKSPRLRGSLIVFRRKCGKPSCQCAGKDGTPHSSPAFKYSLNGVAKIVTLAPDEVAPIRAALDRYQLDQDRLDRLCADGLQWLNARIDARKAKRSS